MCAVSLSYTSTVDFLCCLLCSGSVIKGCVTRVYLATVRNLGIFLKLWSWTWILRLAWRRSGRWFLQIAPQGGESTWQGILRMWKSPERTHKTKLYIFGWHHFHPISDFLRVRVYFPIIFCSRSTQHVDSCCYVNAPFSPTGFIVWISPSPVCNIPGCVCWITGRMAGKSRCAEPQANKRRRTHIRGKSSPGLRMYLNWTHFFFFWPLRFRQRPKHKVREKHMSK